MSVMTIMIPIFFIFLVGYISQLILKMNTAVISKFALYILMPFLVFRTFYQNSLNLSHLSLVLYLLGLCITIMMIASILSIVFAYSKEERAGLILSSAFMNNGNYGTPLILLLFGEEAMSVAIILMVVQQLLMSTLGIYVASKGSNFHTGIRSSLLSVVRMPMVYAAVIGVLLNTLDISIGNLSEGVDLIANAAIPAVMVILGMNLANILIKEIDWGKISIALVLKLLIAPVIALCLVMILPVDDLTKQIMIILAATPSAVNTTLYAIQFQVDSQNVSGATLLSTLFSIITIPIVILWTTSM